VGYEQIYSLDMQPSDVIVRKTRARGNPAEKPSVVFSCVFLLEEYWSKEYGFKAAKRITYFGLFVYSNNLLLRS
jgi:hypothetical protein